MSLTIVELNLAPLMQHHAVGLIVVFPQVQFTSGRRSLHQQAHAMAVNHMQDSSFLLRTYVHAAELIQAIEQDGLIDSVDSVTEALYAVMENNPSLVKGPHLTGDAVDIQPLEGRDGLPTPLGLQVVDWIKSCPDTVDFRTREGRLIRWHWACQGGIGIG